MFELIIQLAQLEAIQETGDWVQIGTGLGFTGLVWYLIVKALPRVQDRFDETLSNNTKDMKVTKLALIDELNASRKAFEEQMALQRLACKEEMQQLSDLYERHVDRFLNKK